MWIKQYQRKMLCLYFHKIDGNILWQSMFVHGIESHEYKYEKNENSTECHRCNLSENIQSKTIIITKDDSPWQETVLLRQSHWLGHIPSTDVKVTRSSRTVLIIIDMVRDVFIVKNIDPIVCHNTLVNIWLHNSFDILVLKWITEAEEWVKLLLRNHKGA